MVGPGNFPWKIYGKFPWKFFKNLFNAVLYGDFVKHIAILLNLLLKKIQIFEKGTRAVVRRIVCAPKQISMSKFYLNLKVSI